MEKSSLVKKKKKEVKPKKRTAKKEVVKDKKIEAPAEEKDKSIHYFEAIGRRKTAVARVRLFTQGEKEILVNDRPYKEYFPTIELQKIAVSSLETMNCLDKFKVLSRMKGGGVMAQAEALKHGLARALTLFNPTFRKRLKKAGYLTRDSRIRERKKFGLKRARRAPQWQKR